MTIKSNAFESLGSASNQESNSTAIHPKGFSYSSIFPGGYSELRVWGGSEDHPAFGLEENNLAKSLLPNISESHYGGFYFKGRKILAVLDCEESSRLDLDYIRYDKELVTFILSLLDAIKRGQKLRTALIY